MAPFVGRQKELEGLKGLLKKRSASLVVVRGRPRMGKSRLAEEFAKSFSRAYFFTGLAPEKGISAREERTEFLRQMRGCGLKPQHPADDWGDLLKAADEAPKMLHIATREYP